MEKVKDEGGFLPANNRKRFFQIDTIFLCICGQAWPKSPKIASLLFLCNI